MTRSDKRVAYYMARMHDLVAGAAQEGIELRVGPAGPEALGYTQQPVGKDTDSCLLITEDIVRYSQRSIFRQQNTMIKASVRVLSDLVKTSEEDTMASFERTKRRVYIGEGVEPVPFFDYENFSETAAFAGDIRDLIFKARMRGIEIQISTDGIIPETKPLPPAEDLDGNSLNCDVRGEYVTATIPLLPAHPMFKDTGFANFVTGQAYDLVTREDDNTVTRVRYIGKGFPPLNIK